MHKIISNRNINYLMAVPMWVIMYYFLQSVLMLILWMFDEDINNAAKIFCLISSAGGTFGFNTTVELQGRAKLTFLWRETNDIWLEPGFYFLFWGIWGIYASEKFSTEKKDVIVDPFFAQAAGGKKILVAANGDYAVGTNARAEELYKKVGAKDMPGNLMSLIRRTSIRVFGGKNFWRDIIGKDLSQSILTDQAFKNKCEDEYGIVFKSLIIEVTSGNLDQDDMNAFETELTAKFSDKTIYPGLTATEISEKVETQLKLAKKIINKGGGNLLMQV